MSGFINVYYDATSTVYAENRFNSLNPTQRQRAVNTINNLRGSTLCLVAVSTEQDGTIGAVNSGANPGYSIRF